MGPGETRKKLIPPRQVRRAEVSSLARALFAVLDGFLGAMANAGHAVGTVLSPNGSAVLQRDVLQRAYLRALAAGDARVGHIKAICFEVKAIKSAVDRTAFEPVEQPCAALRQCFAPADALRRFFQYGMRRFDDRL